MTAIADITMSLDGFVTGQDPGPDNGLGDGGEPLHEWAISSDDPVDVEVLATSTKETGAVVMGRRLFDIIDGPLGWNDDMGYGAAHAAVPPVYVVTHVAPTTWRLGERFSFVTDGVAAAIDRARTAAGDRDVVVMGGAEVIRQAVIGGHVDQLRIHLAPLVLGGGTPLFLAGDVRQLRQVAAVASGTATHLTYVVRPGTPRDGRAATTGS